MHSRTKQAFVARLTTFLFVLLAVATAVRAQSVEWTLRQPSGPQSGGIMVYDASRGKVVHTRVYSDQMCYNPSARLDSFVLNENGWLPAGSLPSGTQNRSWDETAMVYDAGREEIILVSNVVPPFGARTETWRWNGQWTLLSSDYLSPSPGNLVYDPIRQVVVLVGHGQTWEWNRTAWSQRSSGGAAPDTGALIYDTARHVVVLFNAGLTWIWDGLSWTQQAIGSPSPQSGVMIYDDVRQLVLLVGAGGTWAWDGVSWSQRSGPGPVPEPGNLAYDSARRVVILVGSGGTWEWNGSTWSQPVVGGPRGTVIYDAARSRTVLLSIDASRKTWEWDGAVWAVREGIPALGGTQVSGMYFDAGLGAVVSGDWLWNGDRWVYRPNSFPHGPSVYDSVRNVAVYYGNGQTWEMAGGVWSQRLVTSPPMADGQIAFDEFRGLTVLYGRSENWDWNGSTWTQRPIPGMLPPDGQLVYDTARGVDQPGFPEPIQMRGFDYTDIGISRLAAAS